jgi:photosystem II stability/assembly factor-like uncharacterized protein
VNRLVLLIFGIMFAAAVISCQPQSVDPSAKLTNSPHPVFSSGTPTNPIDATFTKLPTALFTSTADTIGAEDWQTNGPWGGSVGSLVIDPVNPQKMYAGNEHFYWSADGGCSWAGADPHFTNDTYFRSIAVDKTQPGIIYAGTEYDGFYKSKNFGITWDPINNGMKSDLPADVGFDIQIDPAIPSTIYAARGSGIYKSTDGGENWMNTGLTAWSFTIAIDPENPEIIYAGTLGAGISKSVDKGSTWASINNGLPADSNVRKILIDPAKPTTLYAGTYAKGIFKSANGGLNWISINNGLAEGARITDMVLDPAEPSRLYAVTDSRVFLSSNGGKSWKTIHGFPGTINDIAMGLDNPASIFAATTMGIYKSADQGKNWIESDRGIGTVIESLTFDFGGTIVYAGTNHKGIFTSMDEGKSWGGIAGGISDERIDTIVIDPENSNVVYAAYMSGTTRGIMKTVNGGRNWITINHGLGNQPVWGLVIDPADPAILYAISVFRVYKTSDGGKTWAEISEGLPVENEDFTIRSIAIDPKTPSTVYLGTHDFGFYASVDSGGHWIKISDDGAISFGALVVAPTEPVTLYAVDAIQGDVYRSDDGGARWYYFMDGFPDDPYVDVVTVDPENPAILYAGSETGVYINRNGGKWTWIGKFSMCVTALSKDPINSILYAGSSTGVYTVSFG